MKKFFYLTLLFLSFSTYGQDTIFLDNDWEEVRHPENAEFYEVYHRESANPDEGTKEVFYKSGQIKSRGYYSSFQDRIEEGKHMSWKKDGVLHVESNYRKGKMHGPFISYWSNGQMKRKDIFKKGKWKEGTTWDASGNEVPYYEFEIRPKFPGGKTAMVRYLKERIVTPKGAGSGKVHVGFVVDTDGDIVDIEIEKSSNFALNGAAYMVVAGMPDWSPALQDGVPVRVKYTLPLVFR